MQSDTINMKEDYKNLLIVSAICIIIGTLIFVRYTLKLSKENQNIMWATGGLAMMALGAGFIIYLLGRKS